VWALLMRRKREGATLLRLCPLHAGLRKHRCWRLRGSHTPMLLWPKEPFLEAEEGASSGDAGRVFGFRQWAHRRRKRMYRAGLNLLAPPLMTGTPRSADRTESR